MTLIAIEEHWIMPDLTCALRRLPDDRPDESLAFNEMGDHQQRLEDSGGRPDRSYGRPGHRPVDHRTDAAGTQPLPPVEAVRLSRAANDAAATAVSTDPSRFRSLSTLPMSAPPEVPAELERAAGLGHVGTMVYGRSGDLVLDDPVYDDFFSAERLRQPVFIHPQLPLPAAFVMRPYRGFDPTTDLALATFGWGWHLDAGLAALRLIIRGTFDRHPDLQVVLGHWGEMLLFWLDRANSLSHIAGLQRSVSDYMRSNFFITTSGMLNPALLQHALSVTSIDRLIFSTDYPFQQPTGEDITAFLGNFKSDEEHEMFTSANAAPPFGIELMPRLVRS